MAWADAQPSDRQPAAAVHQIERHLEFLGATLPSKSIDDHAGKRRFAVYVSLLAEFSNEALAYMAREACRTLHWFPTPRQCLDLIDQYRKPVSDRETAYRLCHDWAGAQFDGWLDQCERGIIGNAPDQWFRIAVERGTLRRMQDGSHVVRSLYHGPFFRA